MLSSGQEEELPEFYHGLSAFDADAARWIAEQLDQTLGDKEAYSKPLTDLFASVILKPYRADVKTLAASNLASILEGLLSSQFEAVQDLALPWEDIDKSVRSEMNIQEWNRQSTDAELRLRGCLLAIRIGFSASQSLSQFECDLHNWVVGLRYALSEETVRPFST